MCIFRIDLRQIRAKAEFIKEFEGDVRVSLFDRKKTNEAIEEEEKRKKEERIIIEEMLNRKVLWDLKW